jgi:hypothetical protein
MKMNDYFTKPSSTYDLASKELKQHNSLSSVNSTFQPINLQYSNNTTSNQSIDNLLMSYKSQLLEKKPLRTYEPIKATPYFAQGQKSPTVFDLYYGSIR